jgi:hypothetical protein
MKRILLILGAVFLIVLVALVLFIGSAAVSGGKLDKSSQAFVDATVPEIVGTWSADKLIQHAAPQLLEATSAPQVRETCSAFAAKLGPLVRYEGSEGESNSAFTPQHGHVVSARYRACATFEHGKADIRLTLLQDKASNWSYVEFNVLSPALMK